MQRIIGVTSGKGGVGKTMTTINLALAARAAGSRVLLIDGDLGLANLDIVMGVKATRTLADILDDKCSINDLIIQGPSGLDLVPSGSGIARLASLSPLERSYIIHELARIPDHYDYIFIDTGAGISPNVLALNASCHTFIVVTTPEPHALTDAYAMMKVMADEYDRSDCALIVNQTRSEDEGARIGERLTMVAKQYAGISVSWIGGVRTDPILQRSVMARRVAWEGTLNTLAGQGWNTAWRTLAASFTKSGKAIEPLSLAHVFAAASKSTGERQIHDV